LEHLHFWIDALPFGWGVRGEGEKELNGYGDVGALLFCMWFCFAVLCIVGRVYCVYVVYSVFGVLWVYV